nr:MAG TPA: hypothetical protein [Caudoviricetes sp.]
MSSNLTLPFPHNKCEIIKQEKEKKLWQEKEW